MLQHSRLRFQQSQLDPFTVSTPKLGNLDLSPKKTKKKSKKLEQEMKTVAISTPPKPYLSIIDFNMLTRGGLEQATRSPEKVCSHHYQKLRSKTFDKGNKL